MDTNASLGRFYAFTTNTSATLPSSASPPDPQSRHRSSGSDSRSDDDGSGSQHSHPTEHPLPAFGVSRLAYEVQNPPSFAQTRLESFPATNYVDDSPYVPPGSSTATRASTFLHSGPDVHYGPPAEPFDGNIPASMSPPTMFPVRIPRPYLIKCILYLTYIVAYSPAAQWRE